MEHSQNLGIREASASFDFADIMQRVHEIIASIAPHDSVERYTSLGVDVIKGEAEILSRNSVRVNGKTWTAKSIVIAAGAEPFARPSRGWIRLTTIPLTQYGLFANCQKNWLFWVAARSVVSWRSASPGSAAKSVWYKIMTGF